MKRVWPFGNYGKNKCPVLQPVMSSVGSSYYGLIDRIMEQNDKGRVGPTVLTVLTGKLGSGYGFN